MQATKHEQAGKHSDGAERRAVNDGKKKLVRAGVAFGIGSAAIVAALLYANRGMSSERN